MTIKILITGAAGQVGQEVVDLCNSRGLQFTAYNSLQLDITDASQVMSTLQQDDPTHVINAAAYTHTSVGIADVVKAISSPVIEVHISNTYARENFRHQSYISANAKGIILGFGLQSYELALQSFLNNSAI